MDFFSFSMGLTTYLLTLCLIGAVICLPSSTFDQGPTKHVLQNMQATSIREAFFVVEALKEFGDTTQNKEYYCAMANQVLVDAKDLESVYYAAFITEDLGCAKRANEKVAALLFNSASAETTEELYYGSMTAYLLKQKKHLSFDGKQFLNVIDSLNDLTTMDGSVKNSVHDLRGSLYHTGLAFELVSTIAKSTPIGDDHELTINIFKENLEGLLELYRETDDGLMFVDHNDMQSSFRTTSTFLEGAFALLSEDGYDVITDAEIMDDITAHILANAPLGNVEDIYHFARLMNLINSGKLPPTMVLSLPKTTFSSSIKNDGTITVNVSDLMGKSLGDQVNVFLMKATYAFDDSVVYSNQQLKKSGNSYTFNFFTSKPKQGFYYLEFGIQTSSSAPIRTTFRTIKVVTSVEVDAITMDIFDSADKEVIQSFTALRGKQFSGAKATYFNGMDFAFVLKNQATNKPTRVQQAVVRFAGKDAEASFPAQSNGESYRLLVDVKDVGKELLFKSGAYQITLIIGDAFIDNSQMWELGEISFTFPPSLEVKAHESVYTRKAEIEHTFRVPDKRPSETVSFAFTVAVLSPLGILLIGFMTTGFHFKFPSGIGFISTLVFLASLYSIFFLYTGFWLGQYNMFQTLQFLLLLSIPTFLFGNQALRAKGAARKEANKSKKAE